MRLAVLSCSLAAVVVLVASRLADAGSDLASWRSQAIYQIVTDRFAGSNSNCTDLSSYCNGTFNGARGKAAYVKDLGFDAVWISPVPTNSPNGYHGYWASNFSQINPNFGSAADLKQMVATYRARGMKVMVDVVANHIGYLDRKKSFPFNEDAHYHNCTGCDEFCNIPGSAFDSHDLEILHRCRLVGLQDLDQDNAFVRRFLLDWVKNLVKTYGFEGIRIDTVLLVKKEFWGEFVKASGVFAIGEANDGDPKYVGPYQEVIPSPISFPMYYTLRDVFAYHRSMHLLHDRRVQYHEFFRDPTALATFVDSHDVPRFLSVQKDYHLYYNALAWVLLAEGIPIVYYGTEAGFNGGADPQNREPLWRGGYDTQHPLYHYIKAVNRVRKSAQPWKYPHNETFYSDSCYSFTRGPNLLVVLTNVGRDTPTHTCTVPVPPGWSSQYLGRKKSVLITSSRLGHAPQGSLTMTTGSGSATVTLYQGAPAVFVCKLHNRVGAW